MLINYKNYVLFGVKLGLRYDMMDGGRLCTYAADGVSNFELLRHI